MNSNAGKLRKPFLGVQLVATLVMLIWAIMSLVSVAGSDLYATFGNITAARIGAIVAFCASVAVIVATKKGGYRMAGAIANIVIASIGFILNFILIPLSSASAFYSAGNILGNTSFAYSYGQFLGVCVFVLTGIAFVLLITNIVLLVKKEVSVQGYAQPQQFYAQPQQPYAQPQQPYAQPQHPYAQPQQPYAQPQMQASIWICPVCGVQNPEYLMQCTRCGSNRDDENKQ